MWLFWKLEIFILATTFKGTEGITDQLIYAKLICQISVTYWEIRKNVSSPKAREILCKISASKKSHLTAKSLGGKKVVNMIENEKEPYYFNTLLSYGNWPFPHFCKTVVNILENKLQYLQNKILQMRLVLAICCEREVPKCITELTLMDH